MADNSAESFSSTAGLLSGAAPTDASAQTAALSRLNPSRPRGFRALVRQAAGTQEGVQRSSSQVDSPRIRAMDRSNPSVSQASGSPLLGRLGEVTTSSFSGVDNDELQEQSPEKSRYDLSPDGRKGSFVGVRRLNNEDLPVPGADPPPTNEAVAQAVQEKVAAAVETQRKYKHVLWYSLFVAAYLIVLYLQASAYNSGEVVSTLRQALMPDGGMTTTFSSNEEVLAYIGDKILTPTWVDPVCGDGNCEYPYEFPAWGRFGCKADCGQETQTTAILVQVVSNFIGSTSVSASVLMAAASWNLCLDDATRRSLGEADLCWFDTDQTFSSLQGTTLDTMSVVDGTWYVYLKGDYAGRVSGAVYDLRNSSDPVKLVTTPTWSTCSLSSSSTASTSRRLLEDFTQEHMAQRRKLLVDPADKGSIISAKKSLKGTLAALEGLAKQLQEAAAETIEAKPEQTTELLQQDDARIKRRKGYKHTS
ncbi:hypothetical protein ABBQ32_004857 [Trebouxia sp. C0010 RCD-2024]